MENGGSSVAAPDERVGDGGAERHERSRLKSVKPWKSGVRWPPAWPASAAAAAAAATAPLCDGVVVVVAEEEAEDGDVAEVEVDAVDGEVLLRRLLPSLGSGA